MSLFALIHGGAHGGWCWELVTPELVQRGHRVVAPDLPLEDPDAGAVEWARSVITAIDGAVPATDEDVVVVGHSLAGLALPVIASHRGPVSSDNTDVSRRNSRTSSGCPRRTSSSR